MTFLGCLSIALLSLTCLHRIAGGTASNQQGNDPSGTVTGDGGTNPSSSHVSTKMAIPRFSRPRFTPRPIYTPLRLDKGNVTVVDTENGHPLYTIRKAPDRGFIITNQKCHKLLEANEKKKARCGFKYKYHTPMNVSFSIDPRFSKTEIGGTSSCTEMAETSTPTI
ncbi:hypothetical protein Pst134EA_004658 [Puccinia striiformis f. sp. tritici]|uniref:hypothetical protein n=1 Tax=Puccinia striiformis f. sp. tritici TaxID=168172 RepID=UPI0020074CC9|nr:hypothetical protein Pst134EA_004658 [Puccinia striiformis f. sp. tritici]KAH9470734.1 hypothetical protein Pst134EA_004658 [Puccinia striiformis f. sp. tritici]